MMENFAHRFEIIYKKFFDLAQARGEPDSKLALSRFLGVSQGRMQHWERGQMPRPTDLHNIHAKLGFAYSWLMTGQGDPFVDGEMASPELVRELMDKLATAQAENAALARDLDEARKINQKLTAKLLLDGNNQGVGGNGEAAVG